jgi:hypothetical protein
LHYKHYDRLRENSNKEPNHRKQYRIAGTGDTVRIAMGGNEPDAGYDYSKHSGDADTKSYDP